MGRTPDVDPHNINRDLELFIGAEDPNGRLDNPAEAKSLAQEIDKTLTSDDASLWTEKYGSENLKAWSRLLKWYGVPENFNTASRYAVEARKLRHFLRTEHLYQEPTVDIERNSCGEPPVFGYKVCHAYEIHSQRYYNQPPAVDVLKKTVELCATTETSERAIEFINELKKAYPDQFITSKNGMASGNLAYFDGRRPRELSRALGIIKELVNKPHSIEFLKKVDAILEWSFTFETAKTYLRFYDQWQQEGDVFFRKLQTRAEVNRFRLQYNLQEEIDEGAIQLIVDLDPARWSELQKIILKSGPRQFFIILGSKQYQYPAPNNSYEHGSPAERLKIFIDLQAKHGPDFFDEVHAYLSFNKPVSLDYIALYELVSEIKIKCENDKLSPDVLPAIINQIKPIIIPDSDKEIVSLLISDYWDSGYFVYDINLNTLKDDAFKLLAKNLASVFIYLNTSGQLKQTIDDLCAKIKPRLDYDLSRRSDPEDLAYARSIYHFTMSRFVLNTLGLAGSSINFDTGELGLENLNDKIWPHKIFWAALIQDAHFYPEPFPVSAYAGKSHLFTYYMDIARSICTIFYSADKKPSSYIPSSEDQDRLTNWVTRMSEKKILNEHPHVLKFLLTQGILGSNNFVPSDIELSHIEELFDEYQDDCFRSIKKCSYALLIYLCKVRNEILQKAPLAFGILTRQFINSINSQRSVPKALIKIGEFLETDEVVSRLQMIEEKLNRMSDVDRLKMSEWLSKKLAYGGMNHLVYNPHDLLTHLDDCLKIIDIPIESLTAFEEIINFKQRDYIDPSYFIGTKSFFALYDFYMTSGAEQLEALLNTWKQVGLYVPYYNGNRRFLHLTQSDISRLEEMEPTDLDQSMAFSRAEMILSLSIEENDEFKLFRIEIKTHHLPFEILFKLKNLPHIPELIDLLKEEGIINNQMTNGPAKLFDVYADDVVPVLANNFETTKKVFKRLRSKYGQDYKKVMMYDSFSALGGIVLKNDEAILGHIARIVEFESRLNHSFFGLSESNPDLTVYGKGSDKHHPSVDDGEVFNLQQYPFWSYGVTTKSYSQIKQGQTRQEIEKSLLARFTGLKIQVRDENKNYSGNESVSPGLLSQIPLSNLLTMQWLLNNLESEDFINQIQHISDQDKQDDIAEHGGYMRLEDAELRSFDTLLEPLVFVPVPSAILDANNNKIQEAEKLMEGVQSEKLREELKEAIELNKSSMNGEYVFTKESKVYLQGAAFLHFHFHSVGDQSDRLFSGPSKADTTLTKVLGDGLVITLLKDREFNVDYYFSYPIKLSDGTSYWKLAVIDLGVYTN